MSNEIIQDTIIPDEEIESIDETEGWTDEEDTIVTESETDIPDDKKPEPEFKCISCGKKSLKGSCYCKEHNEKYGKRK